VNHMPYANCILHTAGRGAWWRNPSQNMPVRCARRVVVVLRKFPVMTATGKAAVRQICADSAKVRSGDHRHGFIGYASSQAAE